MYQDMASQRIMKWKIKKKMIDDFRSKQILRVVSIALRRANFSQHKNLKSILLLRPSPLGTPTGRCPCNPLGARDPDPKTPSPPAWGASGPQCRVLTCILLPLEIILKSLETSGSVAKCRQFSKARYTCILIKEMLSTQA